MGSMKHSRTLLSHSPAPLCRHRCQGCRRARPRSCGRARTRPYNDRRSDNRRPTRTGHCCWHTWHCTLRPRSPDYTGGTTSALPRNGSPADPPHIRRHPSHPPREYREARNVRRDRHRHRSPGRNPHSSCTVCALGPGPRCSEADCANTSRSGNRRLRHTGVHRSRRRRRPYPHRKPLPPSAQPTPKFKPTALHAGVQLFGAVGWPPSSAHGQS
jgi:hypothetical protein